MDAKRVILTHHAYKRHRQRVGSMPHRVLIRRLNTAYLCGLYREGLGLVKLCGVWWGCEHKADELVLTTCLGRSDTVPKPEGGRTNGTKKVLSTSGLSGDRR